MKNFYKYLTFLFIILSIVFLIGIIVELSSNRISTNYSIEASSNDVLEEEKTNQEFVSYSENINVLMKTSMGDITIELDGVNAPISVENFLSYAQDGFYEGLIFHRVISEFMIQGGGFDQEGIQIETNEPILLESYNGLSNTRGTIAMARTGVPNSATSQFFINTVDNVFLDYTSSQNPGYAVFGRVIQGMDVVDSIRAVETSTNGPHQDWPVEDVIIYSVEIIN